jgi:hypothetical protein
LEGNQHRTQGDQQYSQVQLVIIRVYTHHKHVYIQHYYGYTIYTTIPTSAWKVLAILGSIATMTMTMYAETMLIPAIPDLIKDFHVSYSISS